VGKNTLDIGAHLCEMYDVNVSARLVSWVTDGVFREQPGGSTGPTGRGVPAPRGGS
jgi:hypothetical protein